MHFGASYSGMASAERLIYLSHTLLKAKHQTVGTVACSGGLRWVSMWDITELINVAPPIRSGQMDALLPKGGIGRPVYDSVN